MAQMGLVGPMIGQYHSFYRFNKGKSKYGEDRYFKITKDLYSRLNMRLSSQNILPEKIIQLPILQLGHG